MTIANVVQFAVWFGCILGFVEVLTLQLRWQVLGQFLHVGSDVLWMAPVVDIAAALMLGVPFVVLAGRTIHCREDLVAIVFAFAATMCLLTAVPGLAFIAQFILAAGVATQVGRWTQRNPARLMTAIRKSVWPMSAIVLLLCTAFFADSRWEFSRSAIAPRNVNHGDANQDETNHNAAGRQAAGAPFVAGQTAGTPNVLLIVLDTVRADALELTGASAECRTPNLRKLAQSGVNFDQAYSTSPWTLPAHASLLTGLTPHEHNAGWSTRLEDDKLTIAEWLSDRGYRTGAFVANRWYCTRETGIDQGFHRFDDRDLSLRSFATSTTWGRKVLDATAAWGFATCENLDRRPADSVCGSARDWINADQGRPYFAMLNLFDAHDPYLAPDATSDRSAYSDETVTLLNRWWGMDKSDLATDVVRTQEEAYQDCVAYLDQQVGRFLDELRTAGRLDNTIVILTADHGEHFGDHDLYGHGNSLYRASLQVPLIVWHSQNAFSGQSVATPVSLTDLPATIATQVDSVAGPSAFPGGSVLRFVQADASPQATPVYSEIRSPSQWPACHGRSPVFRGAMQSVIAHGKKYILNGDGIEEVYDVASDPEESRNLVDTIAASELETLRQTLAELSPSAAASQEK